MYSSPHTLRSNFTLQPVAAVEILCPKGQYNRDARIILKLSVE